MAYRSVEVANEFLRLPGALGHLTQMQLQKLSYIAHGWNWAINGSPLISEKIEAWDYGPVYPELYQHTRYFGKSPVSRLIAPGDDDASRFFLSPPELRQTPYHADLNDRERQVVHHVWNRYGHLSAMRLSELTHQRGTPWFNAYTNRGRNASIDERQVREHYEQLAERAQSTAA